MTFNVAVEGVGFEYPAGSFSLSVPEFTLNGGERVACVGPSGSGKSTLLDLVSGYLTPHRGRVVIEGVDLSTLDENARRDLRIRRIGMVFQEFELLDYLTAIENILLPYRLSAALVLDGPTRERARSIASELGLESRLLGRRPARLSQGERQRVALARALVTEPGLVLCDEPTGNLDPVTAKAALDLVFEQATRREAAVLVVTHDHGILDRFDRVVDMETLTREAAS